MNSWSKFELATGEAEKLNLIIQRQAMFCLEHFLVPKILILGKETAINSYGSTDFKCFRVEGYEIPVQVVEGHIVYLVGEKP